MIPQKRNIFCIIVHFGSQESTNLLLRQLCSGSTLPQRVIVVDHAHDPLVVPPSLGGVVIDVVRPDRNNGYAAGINIGVGALTGITESSDIVVCMNNDLQVSPATLEVVHEQVGASSFGAHHVWGINLFSGRAIHKDFSRHYPWYVLPYAHGSFLAAEYVNWKKVSPLSEKYFLYWEDVLLSQRVLGAGLHIRALRGVGVTHGDEDSHLSKAQLYYLVRNGAAFLRAQTPLIWQWYWGVIHWLRLLYHGLCSRKSVVFRALQESRNVCKT